jgi:hypothetical protein
MGSLLDTSETTRAFNEWRWVDRDQRAFLTLGLKFAREAYQQLWDQVGQEPSDGETEQEEVFDQRVGGLWPHDYEWMHLAAVVRDSVTSFEVYAGKACREVLLAHGAAPVNEPGWRDLKEMFELLELKIESGPIKRIRKVRHVLTHQRGELRTEDQRRQYALDPTEPIPSYVIELNEERVLGMLDELAERVRAIEAVACRYTRHHDRSPALSEYIRVRMRDQAEREN